ncbi:MAG: FKBP-type peptidyl-prolyl cis-trans isomerase [Rikenellaceae bacterium]|jgi:FKBP-type peptidyl-prolyl cis-trans isomerase FkpA|nr:FKBP-type peptidyl-prolyl cis-trans isomerase [Rikenellaceae bacterium]MBQ5371517.1 FKBP-type peptidyl-prolyl cis-trans isomerase [Rikenellaceae bacterium]
MKKILVIIATAAAMLMVSCSSNDSSITVGGSSELDSLSYALGSNIAYMIKYNLGDLDVNYDKITEGIEDFARGKNSFAIEEATQILQSYFMSPRDSVAFRSEAHRDSISYALGVDQGNGMAAARVPAQTKWINKAFVDVKADHSAFGEGQDAERATMRIMQTWFMVDAPKMFLQESEDFLAKIEKDKKWQKTESGLLYQIVEEGDAEVRATKITDKVKVHYKGLNMEGKQFDSSYDRGEPAEFPLNAVIKGWGEGVMLIGQGGKIKMWLHPDLAYGPQAMSEEIGPNAALYFEVELLEVMPDITAEEPAEVEEVVEE